MQDGVSLYAYPENGTPLCVDDELKKLEGEKVSVVVHHHPKPLNIREPGAGSCVWGADSCPCGHAERPEWLHQSQHEGILTHNKEWEVGGESLDLIHYLVGHRGRIVAFAQREVAPVTIDDLENKKTEDLLAEASELMNILHNLRSVVGEE